MLKKRFLVLAVLLCSLAFVTSKPANAKFACSCAATSCTRCEALCDTNSWEDYQRAVSCCNQAWDVTFPASECGATAPETRTVVTVASEEGNP